MAGSQISTGITVINSLKGYNALSLTNFTSSALSQIASGSIIEISGAFFNFASDETINASSWTAITTSTNAFIALTPSGTVGSQIVTASFVSSAPTWVNSKNGWYLSAASTIRVIGCTYKIGPTSQDDKVILERYTGSIGKIHQLNGYKNTAYSSIIGTVNYPSSLGFSSSFSVWGSTTGIPNGAIAIKACINLYVVSSTVFNINLHFIDVSTMTTEDAYPKIIEVYGSTTSGYITLSKEINIPLSSTGTFSVGNFGTGYTSGSYIRAYALGYYMGD